MKKTIVLFMLFGAAAHAANVVDVNVKALDGFGGDVGAVAARCRTRVGSPYDEAELSRDVAALKASREFQDVSADATRTADGVAVTFFVSRKMRYHAPLTVKGAKFFSLSKIAKESGLKDGALYGEGDFAAAAAKIRAAYNKKYFHGAKVIPSIEQLPSGDGCHVTFIIDEGDRIKTRNFEFEGVDEEHVAGARSKIGDRPWWNPIGWFSDDLVTDEQLKEAVQKLGEYFRDLGYLDAEVAEPRFVAVSPGKADVVFAVTQGVRYKIGDCKITGLTVYTEQAVMDAVKNRGEMPEKGNWAGSKTLYDAARGIEIVVGSGVAGLADTRVEPRPVLSQDDPGTVDVEFAVTEGVPVVVDNIVIDGNDYTKDKVIRREITLSPGDRMLEDHADKSKRRLENLDYFSRVRYYLRHSDKGKDANGAEYRDLVYEVEEKNTGSFMFGVGASSVDSIFLQAEVSQANFDLFAPGKYFRGAGQKGRLYAQVGPRIQSYEAAVTEPWLFDRQLELTVEAYRRQRWFDEYDVIRNGAAATVSYPVKFWNPGRIWRSDAERLVTFGRFGFRLSAELVDLHDVDEGVWNYKGKAVSLREEERKYGDAFEPVARVFWARDTRDAFRFTKSGSFTQIYADLAPAGDNKFWKVGAVHRSYFNVWRKYDHIFSCVFRAETIDGISDDVPIYNRLFLGGPKSIRGIEYRHVSPMAEKAGGGEWTPWGGQTLFCANFEYTVPVFPGMLRIAGFTDVGSVSAREFDLSDDFAWTVGIGFRIDLIPRLPIRLDFATPIEKPDHAEKEVFSFTVGYDF